MFKCGTVVEHEEHKIKGTVIARTEIKEVVKRKKKFIFLGATCTGFEDFQIPPNEEEVIVKQNIKDKVLIRWADGSFAIADSLWLFNYTKVIK